ncbi:MAG TPA: NFACT RNA binding domain-containing protein [Cyclobacteriaceae bacterium]|nr:NFACT RNA binding domain-containing protein [Cyclobacteriaceae bacterium]
MHNNYYFLRKLSAQLESIVSGSVISECFSQNKDELILRFEIKEKSFFIKASLESEFCCLFFQDDFARARKNSVNLFEAVIGLTVAGITQFENERSFSINLSEDYQLLFKMHGNRANVVLFHQQKAVRLFRNHLTADAQIGLTNLHREIDFSYEVFEQNIRNLPVLYYTFGKPVWNFLERNNFSEKPDIEKWQSIQDLLGYLKNPIYYITETDHKISLSLFPEENILHTFRQPMEAVNAFFLLHTRAFAFLHKKREAMSALKTKLQGSLSYLVKVDKKLKELKNDSHYKTRADLLMANLHLVKPGQEKISLPDFYKENNLIEIKLKKDISAQKNAEVFYRKAKNQQIEINKLTESFTSKQKEVADIQQKITALEQTQDLKSLRVLLGESAHKQTVSKKENPLPYHEVLFNGFKIWIGKNAQHNDTLTLKYSFKEDLWLHAKDVSGSHVLIKHQAGKKFPKDVIERAAQLAAFNSKRKTESLAPVVFTPKKFVRKRKGDPPGAVVVEREEVILAEPKGI